MPDTRGVVAVPSAAGSSVGAVLSDATAGLASAGCDSPRLDAELLLGEVLRLDRAGLVLGAGRELGEKEAAHFSGLLARREAREPVAYILGRRGFRNIELYVDRRVLIPRPETELLVEVALGLPAGSSVLDVGCGSGAVALALASERPDLVVRGLDVSAGAVAVARKNAARLGLPVEFACADLLDDQPGEAVLANLPYVAEDDRAGLTSEIVLYEPPGALFAGSDGLDEIRRLATVVPDRVRFMALEVGADQARTVQALLEAVGFGSVLRLQDLGGNERVVVGRR